MVGPIARTAPDAALLLAGMCGTDPGLPMARPDRPNEFLGLRPAPLRGLRVAWTFDLGDLPVQADVLAVLAACRQSLEDAGCEVTDAAPMATYIDWMRSCSPPGPIHDREQFRAHSTANCS